jgi:hypothetical protein
MLYDLTKHHVWSAIKGYVRRKEVGYKRQLQMRTKEGGKRLQAQKRKKGDDGRRRGTRAPYRSPHRRIRKHSPISNLEKKIFRAIKSVSCVAIAKKTVSSVKNCSQ